MRNLGINKITEIAILIIYILSITALNFSGQFGLKNGFPLVSALVAVGALFSLCIFYLFTTAFSIYTFGLLLLALYPLSTITKILHLPGSGLAFAIGLLSRPAVVAILTIITIRYFEQEKEKVIFYFLIIGILLLQILIATLPVGVTFIEWGEKLNYLLLAAIISMQIKGDFIKPQDRKILTILALSAASVIMADISELF